MIHSAAWPQPKIEVITLAVILSGAQRNEGSL